MYIELPERTDDAVYQEREAAETMQSLFTETVARTGMDPEIAAKLSDDTMYAILCELDTADDEYERWEDYILPAPERTEPLPNVWDSAYDLETMPF